MTCDYHYKDKGKFVTRFYDLFNIKGHIITSRDRCEYCKEWLN